MELNLYLSVFRKKETPRDGRFGGVPMLSNTAEGASDEFGDPEALMFNINRGSSLLEHQSKAFVFSFLYFMLFLLQGKRSALAKAHPVPA